MMEILFELVLEGCAAWMQDAKHPVRCFCYKQETARHFCLAVYCYPCYASSCAMMRPISVPITEAIIRPRVQPLESPKQCRP